ncbi:peptidase [Corynebacterium phocae]|uniref:Peptidase n=1 Tax=Corynebacterium phocae TaxID=161895 RepID=A0A1L7D532_9CORY|nr:M3 family metallopeptidase [Corynebacterium phocae]APT93151.1 peptidase [Corynebacterium phocae]KAA8722229.1 M3 family metallopeptidase [Corynebacterium phocae]
MTNPLLTPSELPYQLPDFAAIKTAHVLPAFDEALSRHNAEIAVITGNPEDPTWENTVEALECAGRDLYRVIAYFANISGTDTTEELEEIGAKLWPALSAHNDGIHQDPVLYARIKEATPPEDEESQRLHDHLLRTFKRAGAELDAAGKQRLSEINQRLAALQDEFGRNLLASTRELAVELDGETVELGLPAVQPEQARLESAADRAKVYEASLKRGQKENPEVLLESVALRAERAQLLGFAHHADFVIAEETAGSASAARDMLTNLAPAAAANAAGEQKLLAEEAELNGQGFGAADWPYWESKVRERDFALDDTEVAKYFPLDKVLKEGVFAAANRLYGITVEPRPDLQGYAEGVDVWEVKEEDGTGIGLFLTDYFGRPSKRGGAWMSSFMDQSHLLGTKPVVVNVMGINKPKDGSQPLLSQTDLHTVFHEFGHALHGLLSDVRYPTFSGTSVPRDWVEFPSQINENWALHSSLVTGYAHHVETGEPIPAKLLTALDDAATFGQGFATYEYLAACIIDLAWHSLSPEEAAAVTDIEAFERAALDAAGLDNEHIAPRYKSTFFNHIFAGGYSAGYYSYLWSEVLDADGFGAFTGDLRAVGQRFRDLILSRGASRDFGEAYREFRGRDKDVAPLLKRRGLDGATA